MSEPCDLPAVEARRLIVIDYYKENEDVSTSERKIEPYFLTTDQIVRSGYALVNPPVPGSSITLLDVWICRRCQTEQWAIVVIAAGRVERIEAVTLDDAHDAGAQAH